MFHGMIKEVWIGNGVAMVKDNLLVGFHIHCKNADCVWIEHFLKCSYCMPLTHCKLFVSFWSFF